MLDSLKAKIDEAKLNKFKKAFRLGKLTGKADAINQAIPVNVSASLDRRIQSAGLADRKAIQELLHFSRSEAKSTTEQARADTRTIMANTLGRGIDVQAAGKLRNVLAAQPPEKLQKLMSDLNADPAFAPAILVENLLEAGRNTAREDFAALKDILVAFPAVPERAGKVEFHKQDMTVGRDDAGALKVMNQSTNYVGLRFPPENQGITPERIEEMKGIFADVVDVNYSRQGVALEFMRSVRKENTRGRAALLHRPVDIGQAFKQFNADGAKVAGRYNSGDCMVQAEQLVAKLKENGIHAQVVGLNEASHVKQPQQKNINYDEAGRIAGGMTHTDVMVPYTDATGQKRVLLFVPGMGKPDDGSDSAGNDIVFSDQSLEEFMDVDGRRHLIGEDGGDLDTSAMQKRQLGFLTNIKLTANKVGHNEKDKEICGLDIMRGKLWLNGNATKRTKVPKGLEGEVAGWGKNERGAIEVDLKEMLRNPREKLTIQIWNPALQDYEDQDVTKAEALVAGLIAIGKQFGQPKDFAENILTLGQNLDAYRDAVIDPDITAIHAGA